MKFIAVLTMIPFLSYSQTEFKGRVIDKLSRQGISYVSIGIPGKPIGTVTDEQGYFKFIAEHILDSDSLKFMSIGYQPSGFLISEISNRENFEVQLENTSYELEEVVITPKTLKHKTLGNTHYSKNNCTGFVDAGGNWKGSEAAILIKNNKEVWLENFGFFVIQNTYSDSLIFRLKFYEKIRNDWVGKMLNNKTVIFKIGPGSGERNVSLKPYNFLIKGDFFVSLECLMDKMDIRNFCYSGSIQTPSYYKVKAFSKWHSTAGTNKGGGGADFNIKVSYLK